MSEHTSSQAEESVQLAVGVVAAHADVARVREAVEDGVARGDSRVVQEAVTSHWREHGATHATVARLLGEEVRKAVLLQLRGWQAQLAAQLEALEALRQQGTAKATSAAATGVKVTAETGAAGVEAGKTAVDSSGDTAARLRP